MSENTPEAAMQVQAVTLPPLCFTHELVWSGSGADPFFPHTLNYGGTALYLLVNSNVDF